MKDTTVEKTELNLPTFIILVHKLLIMCHQRRGHLWVNWRGLLIIAPLLEVGVGGARVRGRGGSQEVVRRCGREEGRRVIWGESRDQSMLHFQGLDI